MLVSGMSKEASPRDGPDAADAARLLEQPESLILTVRSLIASLLHRGHQDPVVQDCTQDVLRRALEGRERLAEGRPVRPWVLGIARHVALDWKREHRREVLRAEGAPPEVTTALHELPCPEPGTDDQLARAERRRELLAALEQLPAPQRQALWLFHVEGLSYREIAGRLSVPVGTVGTWLLRGREQLVGALPPEDGP